jgi:hypothetical protein
VASRKLEGPFQANGGGEGKKVNKTLTGFSLRQAVHKIKVELDRRREHVHRTKVAERTARSKGRNVTDDERAELHRLSQEKPLPVRVAEACWEHGTSNDFYNAARLLNFQYPLQSG